MGLVHDTEVTPMRKQDDYIYCQKVNDRGDKGQLYTLWFEKTEEEGNP
jgi:hypothetical protein